MISSVVIRCIVSIGMADDGFGKILFDVSSVSEIPSESDDLVAGIVEYGG